MKLESDYHYQIKEIDILKISQLFHCIEDAIKELIRSRGKDKDEYLGPAEMAFYEQTSRMHIAPDDDLSQLF